MIEDSELIGINSPKLFELYDKFPEIERLFRKIFETAYVDTVNRVESIQFHSAEERYNALLKESPNVLQRVPLKYIASYLGITQALSGQLFHNWPKPNLAYLQNLQYFHL
eukprot:gene26108-31526_t